MIDRLNKYGVCLHSRKKYKVLDDIGESFLTRAVELVKSGHNFVFVLDNIDWEEKVHDMRMEIQNKRVHRMATSIVFSRVSLPQSLPNTQPQQHLWRCNVRQLANLSSADIDTIRMRYRVIVQNLLLQQFPAFESLNPVPHLPLIVNMQKTCLRNQKL